MFGRATITLGIGPHSSFVFLLHFTFRLIIVFVVFFVGRLDQLNYTFSIFFRGWSRVSRVRVQH